MKQKSTGNGNGAIPREWGTWAVRTILLAGLGYGVWWAQSVDARLLSLGTDVAYIKGQMSRR